MVYYHIQGYTSAVRPLTLGVFLKNMRERDEALFSRRDWMRCTGRGVNSLIPLIFLRVARLRPRPLDKRAAKMLYLDQAARRLVEADCHSQ